MVTQVRPSLENYGARIAFENLPEEGGWPKNFRTITEILKRYPSTLVGLCYDNGHGNMDGDGVERLDELKDRLIAVHLHGNHGKTDEHDLPFVGTVNWQNLTEVIATSAYEKPLHLEVSMRDTLGMDGVEERFLDTAFEQGLVLVRMVDSLRSKAQ